MVSVRSLLPKLRMPRRKLADALTWQSSATSLGTGAFRTLQMRAMNANSSGS